MKLATKTDAYRLLEELGAPLRLLLHVQLVGEAAEMLMRQYEKLGVQFDAKLVELGVALHDAGKTRHERELSEPGSLHEAAGEALLLAAGVEPAVARCCVTHAAWRGPDVTLEERTVALADKV
jgi:HD superfamily phosphodiesterase